MATNKEIIESGQKYTAKLNGDGILYIKDQIKYNTPYKLDRQKNIKDFDNLIGKLKAPEDYQDGNFKFYIKAEHTHKKEDVPFEMDVNLYFDVTPHDH